MAAALSIMAGAVLGASNRDPGATEMTVPPVSEAADIDIHVAGWVMAPGVVQLPEGSIVADAVAAAGGFKPGAASHSINLAAPLRGGDQIFVPGPGTALDSPTDDGLVAINRASATDLEALPGVGPVLAERIVAYREEHGPFSQVEDLLDIPGIGESKLASMRDLIRVP